ncbi:MAG: hypothetical protein J6M05_06655 [Cardiobacteriaceae bacterium]|nr:hypothetical protein [Cardiobacteriaceae bacterium]
MRKNVAVLFAILLQMLLINNANSEAKAYYIKDVFTCKTTNNKVLTLRQVENQLEYSFGYENKPPELAFYQDIAQVEKQSMASLIIPSE